MGNKKKVFIEELEDTKTFKLVGPEKAIKGLVKKLDSTSDFVALGILIFSKPENVESINPEIGQEADIWITCNSEVLESVKTYIRYFLDDHDCVLIA